MYIYNYICIHLYIHVHKYIHIYINIYLLIGGQNQKIFTPHLNYIVFLAPTPFFIPS